MESCEPAVKIHTAPKLEPRDAEIVPWFVTGLLKFGLITQKQADAAYKEWDLITLEDVQEDRKWREMMAGMAWKSLPPRKRLSRSRFWWEQEWIRKSRDW